MGQSFDSDRPGNDGDGSVSRLPPVAPPPRKIGERGSIPEMSVFRGLSGASSTPQGSFGPLPSVTMPPARSGSQPGADVDPRSNRISEAPQRPSVPNIVPPLSRRGMTPPPRSSLSRDGLADSITRVNGSQPADTVKSAPPSLDDQTTPGVIEEVEALDWDEEEESTHVFHSSHPPPRLSTPERWAPPPNAAPRVSTARGVGAPPEPAQSQRPLHVATAPPPSRRAEAQLAAFAASANQFTGGALAGAPSTDTLRLDAFEQRVQEVPPMSRGGFRSPSPGESAASPAFSQPGQSPMFPPPPPIPSITQARAFDQAALAAGGASTPGINPAMAQAAQSQSEEVRDVPFVRLPSGNPHTATELAIRKPVLPSNFGAVITHLPDAPRSDPKKWLLGAAGAAALLSIAGLIAFLVTRRPGGLQIEVRDSSGATLSKAEVAVDGRKVCDASPCVIKDLDPGRHVVSVMGETGIEPVSVEVIAGEVSPVSLKVKTSNTATLVASGEQPGLRIFIDNVDKGPLPAKLSDIPPGKHDVRIAGDRYKAFEKTVEVKAGETLDLNPPKLAVVKGRATINVKTDGVSITMVRNDDTAKAKPLDGPFPRLVDVDTASGTWKLVAKKKGYPDFTAALDFSDGVAEKEITVEMKDDKAIDVSSLPDPTPTAPATPGRNPPPTPGKPDPRPDPAPEVASGTGTLNINSIPASRVLLDGQPLGETPRTGVSVSAGTHTVTFIHPELGKKSVSVKVGPGETKTASAKLRSD